MEAFLEEESLYRMALTRIPGIGPVYSRKIIARFGDARQVFHTGKNDLLAAGVAEEIAAAISRFSGRAALEKELRLLEQKNVKLLFFTDKDYPHRLRKIHDSPPLLFYRGNADLNATRIVAVIGTRKPSDYGRQATAQLMRQMVQPGWVIVSGLAVGIDSAAHKVALHLHTPTVGILGHGFGHFYPRQNLPLAKAMLAEGGLLSCLPYDAKPEAYHFPDRNRVVAALCDALVVVETARKGGSLLTVRMAQKYGRQIFAVPGRISDTRSSGCNFLIRQGMATMLTSGEQLPAQMRWTWPEGTPGIQGSLQMPSVIEGSGTGEDRLLALLQQKDSLSIDEIARQTGLEPSAMALLLLKLEMQGSVRALPGKRYCYNPPEIRA